MNKTFLNMQTNVANEVQDSSTALKSIIKTYLNNRYFQVLRSINWDSVEPDFTISVVSGTSTYGLPQDFGKELACRDTTNSITLSKTSLEEIYRNSPEMTTDSGSASLYTILDSHVQCTVSDEIVLGYGLDPYGITGWGSPSTASVLSLVSTSASDTSIVVYIRGIVNGINTYEQVTLTGTTPVNTVNAFSSVKFISKSAISVGKVSITSNSGANVVALFPTDMLTFIQKAIRFFYTPTNSFTVALPYIIKPMPLVEDYDYPLIDISDLLELGAKADVLRYKRQYQKASVFEASFVSALADYIWDKENDPNKQTQFTPTVYNRDNLY